MSKIMKGKQIKKIITAIILTGFIGTANAGETYTPSQLNRMINSGQYPDQGAVNSTTKSVSFDACKATAESVVSQIRGYYPVRTIVNTGILYMVKAWTNDGAITVSCSAPDRKMVLTQASYQ